MSWVAVGMGAALGAWLRWGLGLWLGGLHGFVQVGTLAANLAGGFLVGLALGFFSSNPQLTPEWRLFIITGFLGGLTTFSSFSLDAITLFERGEFGLGAIYVVGSVILSITGLWMGLLAMRVAL